MRIWPFKRNVSRGARTGRFDALVWKTSTLAKIALAPLLDRFPHQYGPIVDSDLIEVWDHLVTIAMMGVAAHGMGTLSDAHARQELKKSLDEKWQGGAELFDDYYVYTVERTTKVGAPWSGVSAMWVADNLRLHSRANAELRRNASELGFINRLSAFMNISFGGTDAGFSHYLGVMAIEAEKEMGIDMGLGTEGAKKDSAKKPQLLAYIFESFARKTVELIADEEK